MINRPINYPINRSLSRPINRPWRGEQFDLSDLFKAGQGGLRYSLRPAHAFADTDMTVPAYEDGGVAGLQDRSGNGLHGLQLVSTARPIYRGEPHRAAYDFGDDVLPEDVSLAAITAGAAIFIGVNGIWIDNNYNHPGGSWSVGPTTYTGGPTGLLSILRGVMEIIVRDEPLAPEEIAGVISAGKQLGAPYQPTDPAILGIRRHTINTGPGDWTRLRSDGLPLGANWQTTINAHPTYAGITPQIIDDQHMVRVPKFWVKTVDLLDGGVEYYISSEARPGFIVHPAFYSAGEEIDQFWIGAYHASEVSNVFESQPNVLPRVSLSGVTAIARMEARNTGGQSGWGSLTWQQICAVRLLCLIEAGTPDVRTAIGTGWNSTTSNSGDGAELQPTGTGDANWRGIYDLWGNVHTLCTGLEFRDGRAWLADENGDLVDTGHDMPAMRYIGACAGGDLAWAFLPTADGPTASSAGYTSYQWMNTSGTRAARHGGSFGNAPAYVGLFSLHGNTTLGVTYATYGFRLAKV